MATVIYKQSNEKEGMQASLPVIKDKVNDISIEFENIEESLLQDFFLQVNSYLKISLKGRI
ncbi:hypothetical protein [Lentilactobacillus kefiri]|uniref:hypothetical protein n=1 Tax=Lentilactobacillus kefiri TaxID=33962 RepID=UPI0006CF8F40|nr:hypothetical protein [Lentilactobacillus kefiri]